MVKVKIAECIVVLEHARSRLGMYMHEANPYEALTFLRGFRFAASVFTPDLNLPIGKVAVERGWTWSSLYPLDEMRQRGMDEDAVIEEIFAIEIEAWKQALQRLEAEETSTTAGEADSAREAHDA